MPHRLRPALRCTLLIALVMLALAGSLHLVDRGHPGAGALLLGAVLAGALAARRAKGFGRVPDAAVGDMLDANGNEFAALIAGANDAIVTCDAGGIVQLFNPAAERVFGVSAADMLGRPLDRLLPAAARGRHPDQLAAFAASRVTRRAMGAGRVQGVRADGQLIDLDASISQARIGGRTVLTAILRDVTERTRAERALAHSQAQLAGLAQRLLAQEKQTTQRLAQGLHDELGQTLAALRLIYDAGVKSHAGPALPAWVGRIDGMIAEANRQVRRVLTELRPPLLDEQGLIAALDNELRQTRGAHDGLDLRLDRSGVDGMVRWPAEVEYAGFMVAREAVNNAVRHARPGVVTVTLTGDAHRLVLTVADDGRGVAHADELHRPGHLGVVGMRERAIAIGAGLDIRSAPGEGTVVRLTWETSDEPPVPDR